MSSFLAVSTRKIRGRLRYIKNLVAITEAELHKVRLQSEHQLKAIKALPGDHSQISRKVNHLAKEIKTVAAPRLQQDANQPQPQPKASIKLGNAEDEAFLETAIDAAQRALGYTFSKPWLIAGVFNPIPETRPIRHFRSHELRERQDLALLGDAVLKAWLAVKWFDAGIARTWWQRMFEACLTNQVLADFGIQSGLADLMAIRPSQQDKATFVKGSVVADMVEAIVGAVQDDGGDADRFLEQIGFAAYVSGILSKMKFPRFDDPAVSATNLGRRRALRRTRLDMKRKALAQVGAGKTPELSSSTTSSGTALPHGALDASASVALIKGPVALPIRPGRARRVISRGQSRFLGRTRPRFVATSRPAKKSPPAVKASSEGRQNADANPDLLNQLMPN